MSYKKKAVIIFFIFILTGMILFTGCSSISTQHEAVYVAIIGGFDDHKDTIIVDKAEEIQKAINSAESGEKIVISPGTYIVSDSILIEGKEDITIEGDNNVRILGERVDMQIFIIKDCESIVIKNISACHKLREEDKNRKFEARYGSVIDIEGCDKISIENCELEGCGVYGIYSLNNTELSLTACYLHHNSYKALGLYNKNGVTNVFIKDCTIIKNADFMNKDKNVNIIFEGENHIKNNNMDAYKGI